MKRLVIAAVLMLLPVSTLAANDSGAPLLPKGVGNFCTHLTDDTIQALSYRDAGDTPQQAYEQMRGDSSSPFFSPKALKAIINHAYFKLPRVSSEELNDPQLDNSMWSNCVSGITAPHYSPLH